MNQGVSIKDATIMWWGGLRGALSMVLVLSLPENLAVRNILVAMVFGVVILSVVVQGSTMNILLKWLKLYPKRTKEAAFLGFYITRLRAINAQLNAIKKHSPHEIEDIKDISIKLNTEKNRILSILEDQKKNTKFKDALAKRTKIFKNTLEQIAQDSYKKSIKEHILTEEELIKLTSLTKNNQHNMELK
jgi:CPA1 family monovalent cation:H+ antiporter